MQKLKLEGTLMKNRSQLIISFIIAAFISSSTSFIFAAESAPTLEDRITRIEDNLAIQHAHAEYAYALNTYDAGGYAALFAEDGALICCGVTVQGRAAIRQFIIEGANPTDSDIPIPTDTHGRQFNRIRHIVSSIKIDFTGRNSATVESYFQEVNNGKGEVGGSPAVTLLRRYEDEWIKQDGNWLIKTRMTVE
jgi:hypothetical protein